MTLLVGEVRFTVKGYCEGDRTVGKEVTDEEVARAKDYALRLLAFSPKSKAELYTRLRIRGFGETATRKAVLLLEGENLIDDEGFAFWWAERKLSRSPVAPNLLASLLVQRGVSSDIARKVVTELIGQREKLELARDAAEKTLRRNRHLAQQKAERTVVRALQRKGFDMETISRVLAQILRKADPQ